jgi:hypothetical protein
MHVASLVAARDVPNVYCYQLPSSTVEFRPNQFIDITEYMKRKLQESARTNDPVVAEGA